VPALAALRDLVRPPDGMTTIELEDGRRVFAPAGSSPAEVKRQLAGKDNAPINVRLDRAALASRTSAQISASACTRCSMSASLWCGDGVIRRRSVPRGTVG
jgi:hypothetical protein